MADDVNEPDEGAGRAADPDGESVERAEDVFVPDPEALQLARLAAQTGDAKQGRAIVVLDVGSILAIADYFVVMEAPNRRLVRALVDEIEIAVRDRTGRSPRRVEGAREQQWVLLDYGDVVVHVFLDEIRRFYEIERLYRDAPTVDWKA